MSRPYGMCPKCRQHITLTKAGACPNCGAQLQAFTCARCGHVAPSPDSSGRCRKCGAPAALPAAMRDKATPKATPETPNVETCKKCGQVIKGTDWTCPHCGHTQWGMIAVLGFVALACLGSALYAALPTTEIGSAKYACWGIGGLGGAILLLVAIGGIVTAMKARKK